MIGPVTQVTNFFRFFSAVQSSAALFTDEETAAALERRIGLELDLQCLIGHRLR